MELTKSPFYRQFSTTVCHLVAGSPINKNNAKEAFSHDDSPSNEDDYDNDNYLSNDNNVAVTTMISRISSNLTG